LGSRPGQAWLRRQIRARCLIVVGLIGLGVLAGPLQASSRHPHAHGHSAKPSQAQDMPEAVQHAYRCAGAKGQVVYSQWPCEGGERLNDLADPRTRAQQQASADQIEREQALSRRMARDRQRLAKQAEGQTAISLGPTAGQHARDAHKLDAKARAKQAANPHAPVPLERCRPPRCFTAHTPKDKKAAS
jgi:hypothetical protein